MTKSILRKKKAILSLTMKIASLILVLIACRGMINDEPPMRQKININDAWDYLENGTEQIQELKTQNDWIQIDLPHTWNQWDVVDQVSGYRRDGSWYKKNIKIPNIRGVRFFLDFEGANTSTVVYVNNKKAGSHVGAYVGFKIDITPYVELGKDNSIYIRVDNAYNPEIIPSQKADFFIYGGITRDLWLNIVPETYISNLKISTPDVNEKFASNIIEVAIQNANQYSDNYALKVAIYDNTTQNKIQENIHKLPSNNTKFTLELPKVNNPKLWSIDQPNLHKIRVQLLHNGSLVDEVEETFGYRWFSFDDNGAFYLNGKKTLIRGTHRHEEHAGYGAAMPNILHRQDIEMIKEMGANFIRLAHYPQDPEVYKACNELGLIVWDELPWCRGGLGNQVWKENTKRLLEEQINQNFNHPSILFWGLGNEIYWLPDFEGGDDTKALNAFVTELNNIANNLDSGRMTAIRKYYDGANLVDVFSPSIWSGWYAGIYVNYGPTLSKNQKLYPRFLHMEYGGSSHTGRHSENQLDLGNVINENEFAEVSNQVDIQNVAQNGDWSENYMVNLFDSYLYTSEHQKDFAGNAQWAFKEFGTPLRPENPIPYINQKGLVDREGRPKDGFYVFKSYWAKKPFTYIESHSWKERYGKKGETKQVAVYSNCSEVSLWQNASNLGKKTKKDAQIKAGGLVWPVSFIEGDNQLIANGFMEGTLVTSDTMNVYYKVDKAGKADHIKLSSTIMPDGNYLIEALTYDLHNQRVHDYEKRIYFAHDGSGELMTNYGVADKSSILEMANGRATIILKPGKGKAVIEARNQDFKGSYLTIDFSKEKNIILDVGTK